MSEKSRQLSYLENYYFLRNTKKFYANFLIHSKFSEEIPLNILYQALKKITKDYPQFNLQVFETKNETSFRYLTDYKLKDVIEYADDIYKSSKYTPNLEDIFDDIHLIKFPYSLKNKPLWRLRIINKNEMIFYCDHIMWDGTSGMSFFQILRDNINEIINNKNKTGNNLSTKLSEDEEKKLLNSYLFNYNDQSIRLKEIHPKPTSIINYNPDLYFFLKTAVDFAMYEYFPVFLKYIINKIRNSFVLNLQTYNPNSLTSSHNDSNDDFNFQNYNLLGDKYQVDHLINRAGYGRSLIKTINIPSDKVSKLIKSCRENRVKLTSLLTAIGQYAMVPCLKEKEAFNIVPVNLRKYMDAEKIKSQYPDFDITFGLYMSGAGIFFPSLISTIERDENSYRSDDGVYFSDNEEDYDYEFDDDDDEADYDSDSEDCYYDTHTSLEEIDESKLTIDTLCIPTITVSVEHSDISNYTIVKQMMSGNLTNLHRLKFDWKIARYFQHNLDLSVESSAKYIGMLQYVNIESFLTEKTKKPKEITFEVSNLGSYKRTGKLDNIEIIDASFSQPRGVTSGYFSCNVIGTDIGGINLVLTCIPELKQEFEKYVTIHKQLIDGLTY
ncbi:hypothetical protein B5S31_g366 [[Candida] boidinii]|nr:hypothetical protein B5S29_g3144 [[Candida] boidinii]OWB70687.1 hypothetical protein B5S31_g366 [[Candida] boidinii]